MRICDRYQNGHNRDKSKNNKSGYKGVSAHKNTWSAEIMVKGKRIRLRGFKTKEAAALAYNRLALKHHGNFARINTI